MNTIDTTSGPVALADLAAPDGGPQAEGALHQYLRFSLGQEMQAIRIDTVKEILEVAHMTPLPLMPEFVRGVMNLRGSVVPVIDLGARLGLGATVIGRRTCVVIVDLTDGDNGERPQTLGVLVDAVHEVFSVQPSEIEPVPRLGTRIAARHIKAMVRVREQATAELDLPSVLRQSTLSELIAQHTTAH